VASTKADNNRVSWQYVSTESTPVTYAVSAKAVYVLDGTDGAKYGGGASADANKRLPRGFRMRAIKCTSAGHPDKFIPVYDTSATLWTTPGTTVTRDLNGVDVVYTSKAVQRGERAPRDTTRQTS
jgi:hypothetical protein